MKHLTLLWVISLLAVAFFSCSDDDNGSSPTILSFESTVASTSAYSEVVLSWEVTGADTLTISPEPGNVTGLESTIVQPLLDTTYVLTAESAGGSVSASLPIEVVPAGYVYLSNPITATGDVTLTDEEDRTNPALDAARTHVPLQYLNGSGSLVGTYADLSATGISRSPSFGYDPPADYTPGLSVTSTESYHFSRDHYAFSEVNCYYHITTVHDILSELGYGGINNRPVPVHAFYFKGLNAFFSSYDNGLHFGYHYFQGDTYVGPDASEDSEVVVHELGHAIQAAQYPYWGIAGAQSAMGEGFSDFIGQVGSGDSRYPMYEGEWFSHLFPSYVSPEGVPYLRPLDVDWSFPDNVGIVFIDDPYVGTGIMYEPHYDGILWSSALYEIHQQLQAVHGPDSKKALSLVVESHYDRPATYREGAEAIIQANTALYGNEDSEIVQAIFEARGFFSEPAPPAYYPQSVFTPGLTYQLSTYAPLTHYAQITVEQSAALLTIEIMADSSNPSADLDLYVRKNGVHFYEYDYSATTPLGHETIEIQNPEPGMYGICIHAYSQDGYYGEGMVHYSILTRVDEGEGE